MASEIENVEIAAQIMNALLGRLKIEVEEKLSRQTDIREMLGKDGLADSAIRLVQTAMKLEEFRREICAPPSQPDHNDASEPLTDEDLVVLRAFLSAPLS